MNPPENLKVIALWQPWATLLARGPELDAKGIETRSWYTRYRGVLLIHATKTFPIDAKEIAGRSIFQKGLGNVAPDDLPTGAIVGGCWLDSCSSTLYLERTDKITKTEREFGDFSEGRWGWGTKANVELNLPVRAIGHQGLYSLDWTLFDEPERVAIADLVERIKEKAL